MLDFPLQTSASVMMLWQTAFLQVSIIILSRDKADAGLVLVL